MKRNLLFISIIVLFILALGCQKEKTLYKYNATFRVDSLKQDSMLFAGTSWIKGTVRVYYTVLNNDAEDIHCYKYTVNAMNVDSTFFQMAENHKNVVQAKSFRHDSTKIGVGNGKVARAYFNNILFQ
jgi:hypothetical protein